MKNKNNVSKWMLVLATLIWSFSFVFQTLGMEYLGPFTFNSLRSLIGAVALVPVIIFMQKKKKTVVQSTSSRRSLWIGGFICGTVLAISSTLQQISLGQTTVGKVGFITALYIVIVPVVQLFAGKKSSAKMWVSIGGAVVGLYLLCVQEAFSFVGGDIICLVGSVFFALHILSVDRFAGTADAFQLSAIQFLVCGLWCAVPSLLFERVSLESVAFAAPALLYAGVMSCSVAFTLQTLAQQRLTPVVASMLLSLESVFAVFAGWVVFGEMLTLRQTLGCAMMFAAIILMQLPPRYKENESGGKVLNES